MAPAWAYRYPVSQAEITGPSLDKKLEELVRIDVGFLLEHPRMPLLYESGVRYRAAPLGEECWLPIPWVVVSFFRGGTADCKSLATWRAAELRFFYGEDASCFWTVTRKTTREVDLLLYHALVRRGDGSVEDPSALLGMGWENN